MPHLDPSVIIGVLGIIGVVLIWVVRKGYPVIQAAVHLAELITGKPAVGKIERVPGLGERLTTNDQRLANIEYELRTNSGGSLRDLVSETKNLAVQNADDARDAKAKAEQAAKAAAEVAQALEGLLAGLSDFANEAHVKEVAVLRALKGIGIDLPEIVGDL